MRVMLAAGGTGGHIYPALAVARAIGEAGGSAVFLGQRGGMEARIVPEHDVPFHGVRAGKWDRQRPDPRQAFAAAAGLADALRIARRERPDAVVAFGGFASFPGCVAATLLGVPLFLHEGNAFPGRVVRWFQRRARIVFAAQPEVERHLPGARDVRVVGFPVREERVPRPDARTRLRLPPAGIVTLVMGGSQGSTALNDMVPAAYGQLPHAPAVLHATGPRWLEPVREHTPWPRYRCVGYVDATLAWSAADLAITRAGISTISEAAFHGVPVIAVPLPTSAEDHQRFNARAVAAAGAGRYVEQGDLEGLVAAWRDLLDDETRHAAAAAAGRRSPEGAARALVAQLHDALTSKSTPSRRREEPS